MRILMIGDGISQTTGFATVLRHAARGFVRRGFDVHQIACNDLPPDYREEPYTREGVTPWPTAMPGDPFGWQLVPEVIHKLRPDVLFINTDPGTARNLQQYIAGLADVPICLYAPVEGAPIGQHLADAFLNSTVPVTYTDWSAARLQVEYGLSAPAVYHGVDLRVFKPLAPEWRAKVRSANGWDGRYVVAYVARNNGRKGHDRLLKALWYLRQNGIDDVLLYLHCQPFDRHWAGGWDLAELAHRYGVSDAVQFAHAARTPTQGESVGSLAQKLAAADLYVHPAAVEGFGLPILEAMACGLPIAVTRDGGNMEEIVGDCAARLDVADYATWFNGATLCQVSPAAIASCILTFRQNPEYAADLGAKALSRAQLPRFRWETMADALAAYVEEAAAGGELPLPEFMKVRA
jgi:glycosyltransferase involved in cell wall biosynthesis